MSTVPTASKYSGMPEAPMTWPTTMLSTKATGMIAKVRAGIYGTVEISSKTVPSR